jgi:hypothetical protein
MKKKNEQPSLLGLLLLVGGMLLLSIVIMYGLSSSPNGSAVNSKVLLGIGSLAVVCLVGGAALSGRKRKRAH